MKNNLLLLFSLVSSTLSIAQNDSVLTLGRNEYLQENYTEALKLFGQAAAASPSNAEIPYLIGHVYTDMNDYKNAAVYFEKAIAMDSTRSKWMYECGLVYYAVLDYKKSLQFIELAGAKGYKKTIDYQENLANAYANTHQFEQAIALYKAVAARRPADQEILYQLAQAYFNAARYQEAIDSWEQLLKINTTNAEALYMTGLCYQKKGEMVKGQQICDKAIVWDPSLVSKRKTMGGNF